MKWTKASKYHMKSDCGMYVVAKYKLADGWRYQAIRMPGTSLLVADTADECKRACEVDCD